MVDAVAGLVRSALVAVLAGAPRVLAGGGGVASRAAVPRASRRGAALVRRRRRAREPGGRPHRRRRAEGAQRPRGGSSDAPGRWTCPARGEGSGFIVDPAGLHPHQPPPGRRPPSASACAWPTSASCTARAGGVRRRHRPRAAQGRGAIDLPTVPLGRLRPPARRRVGLRHRQPARFDHSVTVGVVSSKGRKIFDASFDDYIQTDAAINPGNSRRPAHQRARAR